MLGETIALWMTVEQVCVGLAVLLLVCSCAVLRGGFFAKDNRGGKCRLPAHFGILIVCWLGLAAGAVRMEYEEWLVQKEQEVLAELENREIGLTGRVMEIQQMEYGVRLQICDCRLYADFPIEDTPAQRGINVRRMYVYTDSAVDKRLGMSLAVMGTCEIPETDRNPGGFDYRLYCLSNGIAGIFYAEREFCIQEHSGTGVSLTVLESIYWSLRETIRQAGLAIERKLEEIADPEDLGILKAVLLGQRRDMDEELYELYRRNGISHVLAISGLHVSVVGMGLWKSLRKLGMGYLEAGCIAFGVLGAYGMMTGFGPSVIRAVFMMGISFCAGYVGRTYDLPSAMCVPAMGILLWKPYMLTQAGFQLSFLAVGAMFVPGNVMAQKWKWKWNGYVEKIWLSISLQMITLPFVLVHSYEVPLFGVLLNIVAVPLMAYVLISGILGIAGGFIWNGFGMMLLGGAHLILGLYQVLCEGIQQIPRSTLILGVPEIWKIILYFALILGGTCLGFRYGKRWLILWGIGLLVLIPWPGQGLLVTVLDVGQGDGIYLEAEGYTMLVDCGSSGIQEVGSDVLIPFVKSRGIGCLDTVVVTHGDQDHISGIRELLDDPDCGIEIGQLILPGTGMMDSVCLELAYLAEKRKIPVRYCQAGDKLTGTLGKEAEIICLNPVEEETGERKLTADRNGESIVLYMSYGDFSMLLTGDIGVEEEKRLAEQYNLESLTVLKAAHHGSANSNSREFLEKADPEYVIISYGEGNTYGHPAPQVVDHCKEIGAQVWETARTGAVSIWTDGSSMRIYGWLDRAEGI